jgi:hypothetical protein
MSEKSHWHLRKEVSIINLASLAMAIIAGTMFLMEMKSAVDLLEQRLVSFESRIERIEERADDAVVDLREEMNQRFDRLDRKLDQMGD